MSVDLPEPFGPSSPIQRPDSTPFNRSRMIRLPRRTVRFCISMTGAIVSAVSTAQFARSGRLRHVHQCGKSQCVQVKAEKPAAGRDANGVVLTISANYAGFSLGRKLLQ